jgi:serine/threonine protein kinase
VYFPCDLVKIVLGDFGLVTKELDVDTSISGTLEYLAPERLSKLRRQDPISKSTDIWSLGIILYELFTG